jgi:Holliday junction resolvasome RuvABC endonuclease subunit
MAFDLGTKCGWARSGPATTFGTWNLAQGRYAGGGMRYLRFEQLLGQALPGCGMVAFEEVRRHRGVDASHVYGGLLACLTKVCESAEPKIPYQGYPVATIKRAATGKGVASKEAMLAAARARWGPGVEDDDQADALWVLALAESEYGGVLV